MEFSEPCDKSTVGGIRESMTNMDKASLIHTVKTMPANKAIFSKLCSYAITFHKPGVS